MSFENDFVLQRLDALRRRSQNGTSDDFEGPPSSGIMNLGVELQSNPRADGVAGKILSRNDSELRRFLPPASCARAQDEAKG
jgi:hypothetical protein